MTPFCGLPRAFSGTRGRKRLSLRNSNHPIRESHTFGPSDRAGIVCVGTPFGLRPLTRSHRGRSFAANLSGALSRSTFIRCTFLSQDRTPKEGSDVRNASFFLTDSPNRPLRFDRQTARRSTRLFVFGQCAGSLVLLLVLTASALALVATISLMASTKDLIGNANSDARQSAEVPDSSDQVPRPPQP